MVIGPIHEDKPPIPEKCLRAKRKALESLYCGKLTIIEKIPVTNEETHITEFKDFPVVEDRPCRIVSQNSSNTDTNEAGAAESQKTIDVQLEPEMKVNPGSQIFITQHGVKRRYELSGDPETHSDHQVITLIRKELA